MENVITLRKEVWRKEDGSFASINENPKPKKEDSSVLVAGTLMALGLMVAIVIFWQLTVVVAASSGVSYGAKKYFEYKNDPDRLVINYYK